MIMPGHQRECYWHQGRKRSGEAPKVGLPLVPQADLPPTCLI